MTPTDRPADPGWVHPDYADTAEYLLRWLDFSLDSWRRIIRPASIEFRLDDPEPVVASYDSVVLTRHKAVAPAPFVGWPCAYTWYVAADEFGRQVAASADVRRWSLGFRPGDMEASCEANFEPAWPES